ncbi:hypothetical protein B0A78_03615 [Flavobacterium columnare NBRC 100251 = ATCC 23463]|uniref:Uncharacterized protein n=2 Tax=Flavobacterium columnare TaxID=996 RepID=G8X747_FLACA|nr:hypothetical protein FCOL_11145 [Flavobacterium columnare ATCC 49512]ANO47642.1 hypothetical protein Pf1_02187 [Flavobacterium columnare]PDS25929.1 hypothetical protein B0A78_03615 [Flavobacterium columnare NBRC 100251 = ATCC 23463]APT23556.1 hypothetical protein BU993_03235 [Flavobacterium columnare]AUX19533.1 hypothetical protein AQ623_13025 [Flavobacterium columnare]
MGLMSLFSLTSLGQSLNDYKIALIPSKFSFQNEDNQYRINTTVKMYLKQKGIEAYVSNEKLPEDFLDYNCNKLFVNAIEQNTIFSTRIKFEFKDCKGNVLFTTDLGENREKDIAIGYNLATIDALNSFGKANYKFSGKDFDDEIIQAKLKEMNKEDITETKVVTVKTELFYKVIDKLTGESLILFKTSTPSVFLTSFKKRSGVVVQKDNTWIFECIEEERVNTERIDISF